MIKFLVLSSLLNTGEVMALPPDPPKMERRRNKKSRSDRRRGGNGLR